MPLSDEDRAIVESSGSQDTAARWSSCAGISPTLDELRGPSAPALTARRTVIDPGGRPRNWYPMGTRLGT